MRKETNIEKKPDKQVKISADRHEELRKLAFTTDEEMRVILHEAFDLYTHAELRKLAVTMDKEMFEILHEALNLYKKEKQISE